MKKLSQIICVPVLLGLSASCSDEGGNDPVPDPVVYDIVTYVGPSSEGSEAAQSVFTYQVLDDSPLITLTSTWKAPEALKPDTRVLLAYTSATPGQSGQVTVKGASIIPSGDIMPKESIPPSEPVQLRSLWRTGQYLNLNSLVTISGEASEISLYVKESTLADAVPQAYIVVGLGNGPLIEGAPRALYASWDISSVWSLPSLTALRVNYTDAFGRPQSIEITK